MNFFSIIGFFLWFWVVRHLLLIIFSSTSLLGWHWKGKEMHHYVLEAVEKQIAELMMTQKTINYQGLHWRIFLMILLTSFCSNFQSNRFWFVGVYARVGILSCQTHIWRNCIQSVHLKRLWCVQVILNMFQETSTYLILKSLLRNNHELDHCHACFCKDSPKPNCDSHVKLVVKFKLPLRVSKMKLDTMLEARRRGKRRTNDIACRPRYEKFDIVNSCNGLLLLCGCFQRNSLVVSNPFTGEFIRLPKSENDGLMTWHNVYLGFGYHKKTNEYKVVRIYI